MKSDFIEKIICVRPFEIRAISRKFDSRRFSELPGCAFLTSSLLVKLTAPPSDRLLINIHMHVHTPTLTHLCAVQMYECVVARKIA